MVLSTGTAAALTGALRLCVWAWGAHATARQAAHGRELASSRQLTSEMQTASRKAAERVLPARSLIIISPHSGDEATHGPRAKRSLDAPWRRATCPEGWMTCGRTCGQPRGVGAVCAWHKLESDAPVGSDQRITRGVARCGGRARRPRECGSATAAGRESAAARRRLAARVRQRDGDGVGGGCCYR